jgi:hypothetical protein
MYKNPSKFRKTPYQKPGRFVTPDWQKPVNSFMGVFSNQVHTKEYLSHCQQEGYYRLEQRQAEINQRTQHHPQYHSVWFHDETNKEGSVFAKSLQSWGHFNLYVQEKTEYLLLSRENHGPCENSLKGKNCQGVLYARVSLSEDHTLQYFWMRESAYIYQPIFFEFFRCIKDRVEETQAMGIIAKTGNIFKLNITQDRYHPYYFLPHIKDFVTDLKARHIIEDQNIIDIPYTTLTRNQIYISVTQQIAGKSHTKFLGVHKEYLYYATDGIDDNDSYLYYYAYDINNHEVGTLSLCKKNFLLNGAQTTGFVILDIRVKIRRRGIAQQLLRYANFLKDWRVFANQNSFRQDPTITLLPLGRQLVEGCIQKGILRAEQLIDIWMESPGNSAPSSLDY